MLLGVEVLVLRPVMSPDHLPKVKGVRSLFLFLMIWVFHGICNGFLGTTNTLWIDCKGHAEWPMLFFSFKAYFFFSGM